MIEQLYELYFHDVYRYLKALTRSDDLAEELTQETFFSAMSALDRFKGKKAVPSISCGSVIRSKNNRSV